MQLLYLVATVAWAVACGQPSRANKAGAHVPTIEIAVDAPQSWFKEFPNIRKQAATAKQDWSFIVDSKEPALVIIRPKKGPNYRFDCELVTLTFDPNTTFLKKTIKNEPVYTYFLYMGGKACSLEESLKQARTVCSAFSISDRDLTKWYAKRKFEDELSKTATQTGKVTGGELSVDIRTSFDQQRPWRVTCELSFNEEKTR